MRIVFVLFIASLFLASCENEEKKGLIPEEQFIDVLVDVHLADGTLTVLGYKVVKDSIKIEKYYNYTFSKHNITRADFQNTLNYYSGNSEELALMYEKVIERLILLKGQYEEAENKEGENAPPIEKSKK